MKQKISFQVMMKPDVNVNARIISTFLFAIVSLFIFLNTARYPLDDMPWFELFIFFSVGLVLAILMVILLPNINSVMLDAEKIQTKRIFPPRSRNELDWKHVKRIKIGPPRTSRAVFMGGGRPFIVIESVEGWHKDLTISDYFKEGFEPIFEVAKKLKIKIEKTSRYQMN